MTVISETAIEPGQEPAWDRAFRRRFEDASNQAGWVGLQVLIPLDAPNRRVVVGTWRSRADWEAWHDSEVFRSTREELDAIQQTADPERWHEVVAFAPEER